jgi:hypothetical protein
MAGIRGHSPLPGLLIILIFIGIAVNYIFPDSGLKIMAYIAGGCVVAFAIFFVLGALGSSKDKKAYRRLSELALNSALSDDELTEAQALAKELTERKVKANFSIKNDAPGIISAVSDQGKLLKPCLKVLLYCAGSSDYALDMGFKNEVSPALLSAKDHIAVEDLLRFINLLISSSSYKWDRKETALYVLKRLNGHGRAEMLRTLVGNYDTDTMQSILQVYEAELKALKDGELFDFERKRLDTILAPKGA